MRGTADTGAEAAPVDPAWALLRVAVLVGACYYAGAHLGLGLTFSGVPVSVLWLPNAVLLGALLLTPRGWWWAAIAGAFPAHLIADLPTGMPMALILGSFASNVLEALVAALLVRRFAPARGLRTRRSVVVFVAAVVVAPFLGALVHAGVFRLGAWGNTDFGTLWQARYFSNVLAALTFVPVLLAWSTNEPVRLQAGNRAQLLEVAALVAGLFGVSVIVFDSAATPTAGGPSLLYLPLPFLIWAALRFGPALTSLAFALVAFLVIWGAAHGRGPFQFLLAQMDPLPIQLFLVSIAVPLLLLAAVIEEQRDAERRLRASEELFAKVFRHGPDAVAISRKRDGTILEANERWLRLLGYPPGSAPGAVQPLAQHLDEPARRRLHALAADPGPGQDVEISVRDRAGDQHAAVVAMAAVEVAGEPCNVTILRDVTQQRRAEQEALDQRMQLTHITRVASLSDFSSTIAHELNQPLTAILANAQAALRFLQRDPPNVAEIQAILGEIAEADKRAGLLIHHLRLLMKKGSEEFVQVDINHLVRDVLDFIRGEFLMRGVELRTSYGRDLPQVHGDRVQLQQLVLNLVVNACDAMQGQETQRVLTVGTGQGADGAVQVTVSDNGPGIPPDRAERIFEPFYTTKERGLGMGLAICRRIATAHGGVLVMQNRPGEGASFRLALPQIEPTRGGLRAGRQRDAGSRPTTTAS